MLMYINILLDLADGLVADIGTGEVDANDSVAVWRLIVDSVNGYKKVRVASVVHIYNHSDR